MFAARESGTDTSEQQKGIIWNPVFPSFAYSFSNMLGKPVEERWDMLWEVLFQSRLGHHASRMNPTQENAQSKMGACLSLTDIIYSERLA